VKRTIRNETPFTLEITGAEGGGLVLAPLETRQIEEDEARSFDLAEARGQGLVKDWKEPPSEVLQTILGLGMGLGIFGGIACAVAVGVGPPDWVAKENWSSTVWSTGAAVSVLILAVATAYLTKSAGLVVRVVAQVAALLVVLAICVGLPAATAYHFGDGRRLLAESPGDLKLYARLLQVAFVAIAAMLPVVLFFVYDRYQLDTLRDRLYRDLFRLDRGLKTRAEIDAQYGAQIREAYGPDDAARGRLAPGTRWPVLVCALVMTLYWTVALWPAGAVGDEVVAHPVNPQRSALTFGFLGAYFFGLQLISRQYARGDLKPKAYGYITIRILVVAVLSWVLDAMMPGDSTAKLVAAFLVGIVPDEFFTLVKEQFPNLVPSRLLPATERHPLTRLEGIDLYDRARLEQDGVVNVENLAHHDLIRLVLSTQMPVARLVDWLDQAILYLHVVSTPGMTDKQESGRDALREYGIRTTTDLLACWDAAEKRKELDAFKKLLGGDGNVQRLEVVRDALLDDEWLDRVKDWRDDSPPEVRKVSAAATTVEGKINLARALVEARRFKDAIRTYEEGIALRDDVVARVELARLLVESPVESLRDRAKCREHALRAMALGKDDVDVLVDVTSILRANKDLDDAMRACDAAVAALGDPGDDKDKKRRLSELKALYVELKTERP